MIQEQFSKHLQNLAPKAKKFLLAVSGGSDSVALLRLMHESSVEIEVAHFDHALRETSSKDAEFVRALCETLKIPFHLERADIAKIAKEKKWNLEDAARRLRYSFLTRVAKQVKADAVLTAHTQDDQAETVLMQLLRGAAHLTGMPEIQSNVIRPLLSVSKKEVLEYLTGLNQDYRTDESNFNTTRTRAWLRQEILPRLEERYPHVKKTLAELADLQRENEEYLEQQAKGLKRSLQQQVVSGHQPGDDNGMIPPVEDSLPLVEGLLEFELLRRKHRAVQRQAVASFLEAHHALVTRDALERILGLLNETETVQVSLSATQSAALSAGTLRVIKKGENPKFTPAESTRGFNPLFMKQALKLAAKAAKQGELPVGCVIVKNNEIIAEAHNETETSKDPTSHAEILAMRRAAEKLGDWRLEDCTLYVTLEPCPMCFGTILQAHVSKVVYGARNSRDGALGSVLDMQDAPWKRNVEVKGGVLAKECAKLLTKFFREKR
jgi:tRNA(Ile)-lysidine synthase